MILTLFRFTWKTFISWEIMFYITAAALLLKSYSDRSSQLQTEDRITDRQTDEKNIHIGGIERQTDRSTIKIDRQID